MIQMSFLFVLIEDGKRSRVDVAEQNTKHTAFYLRDDIRIASGGDNAFESRQFCSASGEMALGEGVQSNLTHQRGIDEQIDAGSHVKKNIVADRAKRQRGGGRERERIGESG